MPPPALLSTPAVRRQNLLIEFASLKHASPAGIYLSLTPSDPTLWSGVIFVRKGPYRGGIFRFSITFPPTYPSSAPSIHFQTPLYHPLVSPQGHFSLHHGFPCWFSSHPTAPTTPTPAVDVLQYVRAALADADLLDRVPLSAAENADAWRAWGGGEAARGARGGWDERVGGVVERSAEGVFGAAVGGAVGAGVRFVEMEEGEVGGVREVVKAVVEGGVVLV